MQLSASLCIITRVSYRSYHYNHAATTDYRNTDSADGLGDKKGDIFSFEVSKRQYPDVFLTVQVLLDS